MPLFNFSKSDPEKNYDSNIAVKERDVESHSSNENDHLPPAYGSDIDKGDHVVFVDEQGRPMHTELKRQLKARHIAMIR